jgi:hypothetical protein
MFSFTHFISLATTFQKLCLSFLEVHILTILKTVIHLLPSLLGVEIHRGTWYCENNKSLKMGEKPIFKPSFFWGEKFPRIVAGTNLEHKS